MKQKTFFARRFNPSLLRLWAHVAIGWTVFAMVIPSFFLRIMHAENALVKGFLWVVTVILFFSLTAYLCLGFLRNRKINLLMAAGVSLILLSQSFRLGLSVGLFNIPGVTDQWNTIRAIDNLTSGLGLACIGLAFLYALIEVLASEQRLLNEHEHLTAEVARRMEAEHHLRERETLLRGIGVSALDGIIVMDNNGCVTYWNPAAERILGYEAAEVLGKAVHEMIAPPALQGACAQGVRAWRHAGTGPIVGHTTSQKAIAKNGTELDIELSVSSMSIAGEWHAVGIVRDVTQRKQAEQEYRTIIQTSMDGFLILDDTGRILDVNDGYCVMTGYSRNELLGMNLEELEVVGATEEIMVHIRDVARKGFHRFETQNRRKDGAVIDVEVSANPSAPGRDNRMCAFVRDITTRKQLEEERRVLEERFQYAQKLEGLGVLAGGVAHDFNNILQIILSNINMLERDVSALSPTGKYIDNLKRSVSRAPTLTHQMLAYSGHGSFTLEVLDIGNVIREMDMLIQSSISKQIQLQISLSDDLPPVKADPTQVEQVVMNLVMNASEALEASGGGMVRVSTMLLDCTTEYLSGSSVLFDAPAGPYVCIEVSDDGCGMSEETLKRLFDPFYTTKFTGRGLGMSAVLGIMSAHKGVIIVDSALGEGATIRVLFPVSPHPVSKVADDAPPPIPPTPMTQEALTVLLVDDEPDVLALGAAMLQELGCAVLTAEDGRHALEIFARNSATIDCVLLDFSMPHGDGIQTCQELRHLKPDIPVIIASGYAEQDITRRLTGHEIAAILPKPYSFNTLATTLQQTLA